MSVENAFPFKIRWQGYKASILHLSFLAFSDNVVLLSCFELSPAFLQKRDYCALLYRIWKHGLFSVFSCSILGQYVGNLCCYPSCSRCLKVVSGRLQMICRNFAIANCLEEHVAEWVCGRGRDWSCFRIQQSKRRIWISCAISLANLLPNTKTDSCFHRFLGSYSRPLQ